MTSGRFPSRRAALCSTVFMLPLLALAAGSAHAQSAPTDIGAVDVNGTGRGGLPISSPDAVGSKAPPGSAPALSPSQGKPDAFEPVSVVSDKVLRDIIPETSDYNETAKYTPGFAASNTNGLLGDSKSGWRGYSDGQFNITFDGIPFGDANDPTHHSAAYFPGAFLGGVTIDRGPGSASQIGYATFGGTMALRSIDLSDKFGGTVESGYGSYNTLANTLTMQTGLIGDTGLRGLFQYHHANTDGAINLGAVNQDQFLGKVEEKFDNFKVTIFATYGQQQYNNISSLTYQQLMTYGKKYGAINNNPLTQQYVDYNNSQKATDMEYVDVDGMAGDWHYDNKLYTYSYWYPQLQNNGTNQALEGPITAAKPSVPGVGKTDVIGYIKNNNYRVFGDVLKVDHDFDAGIASGTLRFGMWWEHVNNTRMQEYIDYTTGQTFPALGASLQSSYKLDLSSHITNLQPFVEYDWRPLPGLTITPGFKYESFTRDHNALVNQTTLLPLTYSATYDAALPFLAAHYQVTPEVSVYAQASKGFLAPTVSAFYVANPALSSIQAQQTTNFQAGALYKNEKLTVDADIYQVTATNFPVVINLPGGLQSWMNGGTAQYRGLEVEGTYAVMQNLAAYGSAAAISARYISGANSGLRVGDAPDYTAVIGLIYDDGMFFGSALQKFTGAQYGSSGQVAWTATNNPALNYVKSYNTLDLVGGFRTSAMHDLGIGNQLRVKLGVVNVFNHTNTAEIGGSPATANPATAGLTYSFLPGRTIFGNVSIDF